MKNRQDEQFERLSQAFSLKNESKEKMRRTIIKGQRKLKHLRAPKIIGVILAIFAIALTYSLASDGANPFINTSHGEVIDNETPETLTTVPEAEGTFTMEWRSDSMDRGNHDLDTSVHGNLVVSEVIEPLERGDILYYKIDGEDRLGRLVGLPGETVEIKEGQVYVDDKKLNTFYGVATDRGLNKDKFFEMAEQNLEEGTWTTDQEVSEKELITWVNMDAAEEGFATSMEPVKVSQEAVFVLVDTWWRGWDSKQYGPIPMNRLEGKVLGYEE